MICTAGCEIVPVLFLCFYIAYNKEFIFYNEYEDLW